MSVKLFEWKSTAISSVIRIYLVVWFFLSKKKIVFFFPTIFDGKSALVQNVGIRRKQNGNEQEIYIDKNKRAKEAEIRWKNNKIQNQFQKWDQQNYSIYSSKMNPLDLFGEEILHFFFSSFPWHSIGMKKKKPLVVDDDDDDAIPEMKQPNYRCEYYELFLMRSNVGDLK